MLILFSVCSLLYIKIWCFSLFVNAKLKLYYEIIMQWKIRRIQYMAFSKLSWKLKVRIANTNPKEDTSKQIHPNLFIYLSPILVIYK